MVAYRGGRVINEEATEEWSVEQHRPDGALGEERVILRGYGRRTGAAVSAARGTSKTAGPHARSPTGFQLERVGPGTGTRT